ncbi:MAG TPA: S9 family peptidase [Acidobacteriaceae bacterium]|nr:S9 family peptidase [Acidobacteriaceae bacterium]HTV65828.1 S9 family peptidase [Bryocella sp.]
MKIRCLLLAHLCATFLVVPVFGQTANNPASGVVNNDQRIPAIIHSLEKVKYIRETQLSPDGSQIAWTVGMEGIFVAPLSDPAKVEHITACPNGLAGEEGGIAWSPDSKTLAFFSDCTPDHKTAIFTDEVGSGAAAHMLVELDGYTKSLTYSPDGKYLTFLYVKGATRPSGALAAMKPPAGVISVEDIEVQRVAAVNAQSGDLAQVTPANLHVYEFDWSPDSKKLAYIAAKPPGEDNWWTAKLYVQPVIPGSRPVAGGRAAFDPAVLFDPNTTTDNLHGLQIAVPRWSPDGKEIAFIGGLMSDQGATGGDIYVIPSTGGSARDITPDSTRTASWIHWLTSSNLLVTWIKDGAVELGEISPSNGRTLANYGLLNGGIGNGRLLLGVSVSRNGEVAYVKSSFESAPEVYAGQLGATIEQITHLNDALKPFWGKAESVRWTNEGFHVQGWLLYPANYNPAKKYPLIVYVHGGPAYANMPRWPYPGYGPVPFSALGYFVLLPNPRGSYGEGERFTQANRKDFGYGDLRDILAGVDTVIKSHNVDPNRVGITGWSYGGFMTMFAITQTHRFKAAVAGAGLSDWLSYYGENSIDEWMIPYFGASVYDDPAVYAKSSAINYIKNAKTPTLIVVGDRDGECPAPQSFEFWHALRYEHVPTELVVYPDEGHGFSKPTDRINVLERALGWFDEYMP